MLKINKKAVCMKSKQLDRFEKNKLLSDLKFCIIFLFVKDSEKKMASILAALRCKIIIANDSGKKMA